MSKHILYVEDEDDIRVLAIMALETVGGYTVTPCSSGDEALTTAPTVKPDVLLLDVMMPHMDGPTTLKKLRQIPHLAETPAIFMTARVQPEEIEGYLKMGVLGVIPKPFDPMQLANEINTLLKK